MYSGNETVNTIRKINSRGYAVVIEDVSDRQVVSIVVKGKVEKKFMDDVFGKSSDAIPIYGTAMKNMIDWFQEKEKNGGLYVE